MTTNTEGAALKAKGGDLRASEPAAGKCVACGGPLVDAGPVDLNCVNRQCPDNIRVRNAMRQGFRKDELSPPPFVQPSSEKGEAETPWPKDAVLLRYSLDYNETRPGFIEVERELAARVMNTLRASPAACEGQKRWPFVESPGEFADRLTTALRLFDGYVLGAVRNVLIENPPQLAACEGRGIVTAEELAAMKEWLPLAIRGVSRDLNFAIEMATRYFQKHGAFSSVDKGNAAMNYHDRCEVALAHMRTLAARLTPAVAKE